ncbi:protein of unknown function [Methylorubrum extorquens]|uniref:Uncharacterized protein n=1 Tax=Methylorubrum extorquens TaxID=408 RepID=A0A2N9AJV1_METEX|nr:protein of unknown function [Methylorubrum extorquens]
MGAGGSRGLVLGSGHWWDPNVLARREHMTNSRDESAFRRNGPRFGERKRVKAKIERGRTDAMGSDTALRHAALQQTKPARHDSPAQANPCNRGPREANLRDYARSRCGNTASAGV